MRTFASQWNFLLLCCAFYAVSSIEIHEFGRAIRNAAGIADVRLTKQYNVGEGLFIKSNGLQVNLTNRRNGLTTVSTSNGGPVDFTSQSCIPTVIVTATSTNSFLNDFAKVKTRHSKYSLALLENVSALSNFDDKVLEAFAVNKVIIGTFGDVQQETEGLLRNYSITILANLVLPEGVDTSKRYMGYLFVFDVFPGERSLLANLVLLEEDKELDYCTSDSMDVTDLAHDFRGKPAIFPGYEYPSLESGNFEFYDHYGTHVDAPAHITIKSSTSSEDLHLLRSYLPCIKVQQEDIVTRNVLVAKEAYTDWEKEAGQRIPEKSLILVDTGYHRLWNSPDEYLKKGSGSPGFPGLDPGAVEWLIKNRGVTAVGIDTLSTDAGNSTELPTHIVLARNDVLGIENVGNLDSFPDATGVTQARSGVWNPIGQCLLVYLRSENGTGAPTAIFAHIARPGSQTSSGANNFSTKTLLLTMLLHFCSFINLH